MKLQQHITLQSSEITACPECCQRNFLIEFIMFWYGYTVYAWMHKLLSSHAWTASSSQRLTLPKQENMHPISKVIILNNDQHQHKKIAKIATTNNRINSKIKQQHTTFVDWCYCLREVLFQKMFGCCLQVCLA